MEPIYKSPLISFINKGTGAFFEHAQGDYTELNVKLKRLEELITQHQPEKPVVFFYVPPKKLDSLDESKNNHLLVGKEKAIAGIFTLRQTPPAHAFMLPVIGSQPSSATYVEINIFDYKKQESVLKGLVDNVIGSMEKEYDVHPLLHNHQVEFRRAKYIDNRQASSLWSANLPQGEYPLSKPLFDNIVEQLDKTEQAYEIKVDFVTDWKKQASSFNGPPQMFALEVRVLMNQDSFPVIKAECTEKELLDFEHDSELLDAWLQPMFSTLNANIPSFYAFLAKSHESQANKDSHENSGKPKLH